MIAEEQINALIAHCKRQKEKSFSRLIRDEHSDTLECLEELLDLRKSMKWHDLRKNPNDLPEIDDAVIAMTKNGKYVINKMNYPTDCHGTFLSNRAEWNGSYNVRESIIAWMELPQF